MHDRAMRGLIDGGMAVRNRACDAIYRGDSRRALLEAYSHCNTVVLDATTAATRLENWGLDNSAGRELGLMAGVGRWR